LLTAIDRLTARLGRIAMSPRAVLVIWALVIGSIFLMRSLLFTGADADDSEQLICMQQWALSCGPRNPPLFTWIGIIFQPLFGPTIAAVIFVKFLIIGSCLFLLYLSSRLVLHDRALAALVALSPIGIYYFAWDASFHYTHSVMVSFAVCLTFYLLLVLERRRDLLSYVLFGISIAVGALSKFNYLLFLAGMFIAMTTDGDFRRLLLTWRMAIAIAIGALLASPYYVWLWYNRGWATALAKDRFTPGGTDGAFVNLVGLGELSLSVLNFVLPLAVFLLVFFPRAWGRAGGREAVSRRYRRLLEIIFLAMLVMTLVGVFALDASRIRSHYMFVLILFPLLIIARAQAAGTSPRPLNLYASVLVILAVTVPAGVLVKYAIDPLRGSKAYYHVPYAVMSQKLRDAGFTRGTIMGDSLGYPLAGNFLPYFPDSRIVNLLDLQLELPKDFAQARAVPTLTGPADGKCLLLWTPDRDGYRKQVMIDRAERLLDADIAEDSPVHSLTAEFQNGRGRTITFEYILVPGTGTCH
jgi:Dolichyl-phosphate-mannose-protein mannosyltransferase